MGHLASDLAASVAVGRPRVALLVDGENISSDLAGRIIREALSEGELVIRRVYGDAIKMPKWCAAPGFRIVHSGNGKNATDLLLSIEAMAFMLNRQADVLCVAASDGDYTHLATHLRESGFKVIGLGEAKASERLRKAFSRFREVGVPQPATESDVVASQQKDRLLERVIALIRLEGDDGGFTIVKLSGRMHALHQTKISTTPEKTWRKFLEAHPKLFACDEQGPDAKVRLLSKKS